MKKENIKLIKLFEEIINEVGDLNNIPVLLKIHVVIIFLYIRLHTIF
jgi:hypothetical protein